MDGDSKLVPQLQVADRCAGCINHLMKCRQADRFDRLGEGIAVVGCLDWIVNAVLPRTKVTPDELGTRGREGVNPIGPMSARVARTRSLKR